MDSIFLDLKHGTGIVAERDSTMDGIRAQDSCALRHW
jgi:hypothetical protein